MNYIKLTNSLTGCAMYINMDNVLYIDELVSGDSRVILIGNNTKVVKESPEDIMRMLGHVEKEVKLTPC